MKLLLSIFFFVTKFSFAQEIICLDTVTISGFFFKIKDNRLSPEAFINDNEHFNFIPEISLEKGSLNNLIREKLIAETDVIKYLSYKPTKDISLYTKDSCIKCLEKVININPFSKKNKLYKIKGDKYRKVQLSFVKVTWLHLKIKKSVACGNGFDRPASLFCDSSNELFFDIFVPLFLLEVNNSFKIKNGKLIL